MTYTIEQLENIVSSFDTAQKLGEAVIIEGLSAIERVAIARQLLDTMRTLQAAQARIEAAAAIPAKPQESANDFEAIIYNEMRAAFRAALGLEEPTP